MLFHVNLVIARDGLERKGFLIILKEPWLVVAAFAVAPRNGRVLAGGVGVTRDTIDFFGQNLRVVHLHQFRRRFSPLVPFAWA